MNDLISRREAIDAIKNADVIVFYDEETTAEDEAEVAIVSTKKSVVASIEELPSKEITQEDVEAYCRSRCLVVMTTELFECLKRGLPSAQPEIIRCKDCKYASPNGKYGCKAYHFKQYETHAMHADDYCSKAERREDE